MKARDWVFVIGIPIGIYIFLTHPLKESANIAETFALGAGCLLALVIILVVLRAVLGVVYGVCWLFVKGFVKGVKKIKQ